MLIPGVTNTKVFTNTFLKQRPCTWCGLGKLCSGIHLLIMASTRLMLGQLWVNTSKQFTVESWRESNTQLQDFPHSFLLTPRFIYLWWTDTFSAVRSMHIRNNATKYSKKHTCSFKPWKLRVFSPPGNSSVYFLQTNKNITTMLREQKTSWLLMDTGFGVSLKPQTPAAHCLKHIYGRYIKKLNFWHRLQQQNQVCI